MIWLLIGLVIVILGGTLGETLLWWYIWNRHSYETQITQTTWTKAIIFLTGISDYAAENLQVEQIDFLREIGKQYPADVILTEPFPYDKLTPKKFARFEIWRYLGFKEPPLWVISQHNFWQTALTVCFEKAYGDRVARCIINRIGLARSQTNSTLIFICGSAGATLALAATPMLKERWQSRIIIISYGGVFRSSPGFNFVDNFYHLIGEKDRWAKLGEIVFRGRFFSRECLDLAKQENRFSVHYTGEHKHMEYLSANLVSPDRAKTYRELTLDTITSLQFWQ